MLIRLHKMHWRALYQLLCFKSKHRKNMVHTHRNPMYVTEAKATSMHTLNGKRSDNKSHIQTLMTSLEFKQRMPHQKNNKPLQKFYRTHTQFNY